MNPKYIKLNIWIWLYQTNTLANSENRFRAAVFAKADLKYFTDCSKAVLLLWIFCFFCLVFAMPLCHLFICALWSHAGKGLTAWLSFMVSNCEFVTFPWVLWVRCGTWFYRFLIFAPLLTLKQSNQLLLWNDNYWWIKMYNRTFNLHLIKNERIRQASVI